MKPNKRMYVLGAAIVAQALGAAQGALAQGAAKQKNAPAQQAVPAKPDSASGKTDGANGGRGGGDAVVCSPSGYILYNTDAPIGSWSAEYFDFLTSHSEVPSVQLHSDPMRWLDRGAQYK